MVTVISISHNVRSLWRKVNYDFWNRSLKPQKSDTELKWKTAPIVSIARNPVSKSCNPQSGKKRKITYSLWKQWCVSSSIVTLRTKRDVLKSCNPPSWKTKKICSIELIFISFFVRFRSFFVNLIQYNTT